MNESHAEQVIESGGRSIRISNPDKVLFPENAITKLDLCEFYQRVAGWAVPYCRDRPLTMHRFPDGIDTDGFYQKNAPDYFPPWIKRVNLEKEGGHVSHVLANDAATLVYLASQGMITPHIALSRTDRRNHPDRLVFDLDPSNDDFTKVQQAADRFRSLFSKIDIPSYVQTTGSRGLHIIVPLDRERDFDAARQTARNIAQHLADRYSSELTTEQRKADRGDRVYLDTGRNAYGQTHVAPYAVRALPGAPVATPVDWSEALSSKMTSRKYGIKNLFRRLAHKIDPWENLDAEPQDASSIRP